MRMRVWAEDVRCLGGASKEVMSSFQGCRGRVGGVLFIFLVDGLVYLLPHAGWSVHGAPATARPSACTTLHLRKRVTLASTALIQLHPKARGSICCERDS